MKTLLPRSLALITTNGGTSVAKRRTLLLPGAGLAGMAGPRCRRNLWAVAAKASILGLAFLWAVGPAAAQNSWLGLHPVNTLDFWSNAGEWSLGTVPDGSTDINIAFDDVGGDTSFTNRHTLTIGGPARLIAFSPTTITNSGAVAVIANAGTLANNGILINELGAQLSNKGEIQNFSGGLISNNLNSTIQNDSFITNEAGGMLSNSGTLTGFGRVVNLGTLDNFGQIQNAVTNIGGTINNNGGSIRLFDATFIGGTLNNASGIVETGAPGATVMLDGSNSTYGAVTIQGTYTSPPESTTYLKGTIDNRGNIQVNAESGFTTTSLIILADAILQGGGTITLASNGGGSAILSVSGPLTVTNVDNVIQGAGDILNLNFVNEAAGAVNANVSGQAVVLANDKVTNVGLLEATGGGLLFIESADVINVGGTIAALNGAIKVDSGTLTNGGTIQVNAGSTLLVNTPFTQTSGKTQVDGLLTATLGESISGGTVLGTGTINGNITITGGTMHPGGSNSPGTLMINGDLAESNALFDELIGASGNGLVIVNGTDTLGAATNLNIELLGGFTPFAGQTFTIMDFFTGIGVFANAPASGFEMDGFNWTIVYGTNSIVLDAVAPAGEGGGGGGGTSVPEPGTGVLLLGGIATMFCASLVRKRLPMHCA